MKHPLKSEPIPPYWKYASLKHASDTKCKRDEHGFPVFHDDGVCQSCKRPAKVFSHPWYQFKYQILGYCEACTIEKMGPMPTDEERKQYEKYLAKKNNKIQTRFLWPDEKLVQELEQLAKL